jgi:hypothetical protein
MPSTNPYTSSYQESYYAQLSPEEKAMLNPAYQNIGQQQNFQTQQMQQGNALTQAAGQTKDSGGGMNALALASMLRKKEEKPVYKGPDYGTNPNFSNSYFDKMSFD